MALTRYGIIFDEILENREQFEQDSDRAVQEMTDNLVPVYTAEIISEWTELPSDKSDRWEELGTGEGKSITSLMSLDLYLYYLEQVEKAWTEVQGTHVCETPLPENMSVAHGTAMASCSNCSYRCAYWECACELEHDCEDNK